jgi:hypothetical protein
VLTNTRRNVVRENTRIAVTKRSTTRQDSRQLLRPRRCRYQGRAVLQFQLRRIDSNQRPSDPDDHELHIPQCQCSGTLNPGPAFYKPQQVQDQVVTKLDVECAAARRPGGITGVNAYIFHSTFTNATRNYGMPRTVLHHSSTSCRTLRAPTPPCAQH